MNLVIDVQNATKTYKTGFFGKKNQVLKGINFSVEKGKCFGLLGPNGAGKTTTMKLLVGLIRPTKGSLRVLGKSPFVVKNHFRIGYLPENPYMYNYLTGIEFLNLCGSFFNLRGKNLKVKIDQLIDLVGLEKKAAKKQLKTYSKGMLQRIGIAQALINDPEIVFFDEPMSGLDPMGRHDVKEIIKLLKTQRKTILFNSHILSDVEEICDRAAIICKGKIIKEGDISEIVSSVDNIYEVTIQNLSNMGKKNIKRISLKLLRGSKENEIKATFNDIDSAIKGMTIAKQSGGVVLEMKPYKLTLEESFVQIINDFEEEIKGK